MFGCVKDGDAQIPGSCCPDGFSKIVYYSLDMHWLNFSDIFTMTPECDHSVVAGDAGLAKCPTSPLNTVLAQQQQKHPC